MLFINTEEPENNFITVILFKNNVIGLLALNNDTIIQYDSRDVSPTNVMPKICQYDNSSIAREYFDRSIKTSIKNGWKIGYNGSPMIG